MIRLLGGMKVNVVIVEDDYCFAKKLKDDLIVHFCQVDREIKIDIVYKDFSNNVIMKNYFFYFIDIDLQELDGFDLAKQIKDKHRNSYIIFVSAKYELVHQAMGLKCYYFIRKNSYDDDLQVFYSLIDKELKDDQFIELNYRSGKTLIPLNQIIYIECQNHYLRIVLDQNEYYDNRTLNKIISVLPNTIFVQIHRSYLINIKFLKQYKKDYLVMSNGDILKISYSYRNAFDEFYQEYLIR